MGKCIGRPYPQSRPADPVDRKDNLTGLAGRIRLAMGYMKGSESLKGAAVKGAV